MFKSIVLIAALTIPTTTLADPFCDMLSSVALHSANIRDMGGTPETIAANIDYSNLRKLEQQAVNAVIDLVFSSPRASAASLAAVVLQTCESNL